MRRFYGLFYACVLSVLLSACAVADVQRSGQAPEPIITLGPPPQSTYQGECSNFAAIEEWSQTVYFSAEEFQRIWTVVASKQRSALHGELSRLAELRDKVAMRAVPDCAVETHDAMMAAMDGAVQTLLAYYNEDISSLGSSVDYYKEQLQHATRLHDALSGFLRH